MQIIDAILNRRSIRKFTPEQVPPGVIEQMLQAAMFAPSAKNLQPWQFLVVQKRETLDALMQVHPHANMLSTATLAILVCGDTTSEPSEAYLNQNCSAATQNLLLTGHLLGIGTVWLGVYPRPERVEGISKLLCLPPHIIPISLIAAGYPDESPERPRRYFPEKVHHEQWQSGQ